MASNIRPPSVTSGAKPLRLDAALTELLTQPLEPVARAELETFRDALAARLDPREMLDPPGLSGEVFAAILPSLPDPGVLRLERRRRLLHGIAARLEAAEGGPEASSAARGGTLAVRRELRAMALLHHNRDSLIEA